MHAATALPSQRLVWHLLEMLLAMAAGMLLLAPVAEVLWPVPPERVDLHTFRMAGTMTAGMVAWTLLRQRSRIAHLAAMVAAMWTPYLLLSVPYHLGAIEGDVLTTGGHVLMLPGMYLALRIAARHGADRRVPAVARLGVMAGGRFSGKVALVTGAGSGIGRLDRAFDNAGIIHPALDLHEQEVADWDRVFAVNARGVVLSMKWEIPLMLAGGGGSIFNGASTLGLVGTAQQSIYSASKHAVVGLARPPRWTTPAAESGSTPSPRAASTRRWRRTPIPRR